MPTWLAPFVGAAVGGALGLKFLSEGVSDWKEYSLAFAGVGFVAGLIVVFVDMARRKPQLTPVCPPPPPAAIVPARQIEVPQLPQPSNKFIVARHTGIFVAAGAVFMLLGAASTLFIGLPLLFGWLPTHDGSSPVLPGVMMTVIGAFIVLFGFAQLSTSLVRGRPVFIGFRQGICVSVAEPGAMDGVPLLPGYVRSLVDMFTGAAWRASRVILAWQSLQVSSDKQLLKRKLLLFGRKWTPENAHEDQEPFLVELDEAALGNDLDQVLLQLQQIIDTPDIQQTLPPLPEAK